jgi:hypothetical protein
MFHPWETFYLLTGTSAAALVGVMFIVTTLTIEIGTEQVNRGIAVYENPIIFHLCATLVASALAIVPDTLLTEVAILLVALGIAGIVYSALTLWRTLETTEFYEPTLSDRIFYGLLPCLLYVLMTAGAVALLMGSDFAAEAIRAAALLLLLTSIRNAWDMATFVVRYTRATRDNGEGKK